MAMERYRSTRFWAVYDESRELVCLCVYMKGAIEVSRRLGIPIDPPKDLQQESTAKPVRDTSSSVYQRAK